MSSVAVIAARRRRRGSGSVLLLTDTFTRTNAASLGSTESGGSLGAVAWTASSGTWATNGTQGFCTTTSGARNIAYVDSGRADVIVKAAFAVFVAGTGVIARCTAGTNGIGFAVNSANDVILYKVVATVVTSLGTALYTTNANDVFEIRASGSSLGGYVNGTLLVSATDAFNSTATAHGLVNFNDITSRYDNFSVTTN